MPDLTSWLMSNIALIVAFGGGSVMALILREVIDYFRRERRLIVYSVLTQTLAQKAHDAIQVTFGGEEVESVHLVTVEITNTGNAALHKVPIYISLPDSKKWLGDMTVNKPGMHCQFIDAPACAIECDFLNKSDSVTLNLTLLDAVHTDISLHAQFEKLITKRIGRNDVSAELAQALIESAYSAVGLGSIYKILTKKRPK